MPICTTGAVTLFLKTDDDPITEYDPVVANETGNYVNSIP